MFGLFKKSLPADMILSDIAEASCGVKNTIQELLKEQDLNQKVQEEELEVEIACFAYIIGWYAIQTSKISFLDKHRFSVNLIRKISDSCFDFYNVSVIKFFQDRVIAYRHALDNGTEKDNNKILINNFMDYIEADNNDQMSVGFQLAIYPLINLTIRTLRDHINNIRKDYKFTY